MLSAERISYSIRPVEHFYIAFIYAARINVYSGRLESLIFPLLPSASIEARLLLPFLVVAVVYSISRRSSHSASADRAA